MVVIYKSWMKIPVIILKKLRAFERDLILCECFFVMFNLKRENYIYFHSFLCFLVNNTC